MQFLTEGKGARRGSVTIGYGEYNLRIACVSIAHYDTACSRPE